MDNDSHTTQVPPAIVPAAVRPPRRRARFPSWLIFIASCMLGILALFFFMRMGFSLTFQRADSELMCRQDFTPILSSNYRSPAGNLKINITYGVLGTSSDQIGCTLLKVQFKLTERYYTGVQLYMINGHIFYEALLEDNLGNRFS